jgi:hypothetical protein
MLKGPTVCRPLADGYHVCQSLPPVRRATNITLHDLKFCPVHHTWSSSNHMPPSAWAVEPRSLPTTNRDTFAGGQHRTCGSSGSFSNLFAPSDRKRAFSYRIMVQTKSCDSTITRPIRTLSASSSTNPPILPPFVTKHAKLKYVHIKNSIQGCEQV